MLEVDVFYRTDLAKRNEEFIFVSNNCGVDSAVNGRVRKE